MKQWQRLALLLALGFLGALLNAPLQAAPLAQAQEWPIPGGRFFTQTGGGSGLGFAVVDDPSARFWSEYQRLGGAPTVGYPISQRFEYDGFVTQAFQKLVLQWRPEVGQAWPVNVFDELSRHGFNQQLFTSRQTPFPLADFDRPGDPWAEIVRRRQGLLEANPAIRARYFSVGEPLNVFGLPTSRVEDMDNHWALRTQRAVFQQWKEDVPWARRGQVTIANGGDIAKELGWLQGYYMQPLPFGGPTPVPYPTPYPTPTPPPIEFPAFETHTLLVGPGRLYALQKSMDGGARLLFSDDQGASWQRFGPARVGGLPTQCVNGLTMNFAALDDLYLATCIGIFRWQGNQWIPLTERAATTVAVAYQQPAQLWAVFPPTGGSTWTIQRSRDGGQSWRDAMQGIAPLDLIVELAIDPRDPNRVYALSATGRTPAQLYRWEGSAWAAMNTPSDTVQPYLGLDGATGDLYLGSINGQVWYSPDPDAARPSEVSWQRRADLGQLVPIRLMAVDSSRPSAPLLYGMIGGSAPGPYPLYRSTDGGQSWQPMPAIIVP